jgi:hypothetical protein
VSAKGVSHLRIESQGEFIEFFLNARAGGGVSPLLISGVIPRIKEGAE